MRSMISFAALIAAIGFSGCCGTGGSCPLSAHGGKLGNIGSNVASAAVTPATHASYTQTADCGCGDTACGTGACGGGEAVEYVAASSDCGCGSAAGVDSSAAACACGEDAVVSVSAPYDCGCSSSAPAAPAGGSDCGCSASAPTSYAAPAAGGDCGCSAPVATYQAAPAAESDCGCSSCGSAAPVATPIQYSAPAANAGGCSACQGASVEAPVQGRGLISGKGMGMGMKDRGLACADGSERHGFCQKTRSFKPERTAKKTLAERFGLAKTKATPVVQPPAKIELVSNDLAQDCVECSGAVAGGVSAPVSEVAGRHISHGVIADVRGATRNQFGDSAAVPPIVNAPAAAGHFSGQRSCGIAGCGHSGRLCGGCNKLRNLAGLGSGNPYGGAIPHTAQQPGQSGLAPAYAYPYYTTRGPRDFLRDNPPSIGR